MLEIEEEEGREDGEAPFLGGLGSAGVCAGGAGRRSQSKDLLLVYPGSRVSRGQYRLQLRLIPVSLEAPPVFFFLFLFSLLIFVTPASSLPTFQAEGGA